MAKRERNARPLSRSRRRSNKRRKKKRAGARKGRSASKKRSNQPGHLIGEIGGTARQTPAVEVYKGSELREGNPIDYHEMAERFHRRRGKSRADALKRRLIRYP